MRFFTIPVVVVCILSAFSAWCCADEQKRPQRKSVKLHGYIVRTGGANETYLYWTDNIGDSADKKFKALAFADDATFKRAEQLQNKLVSLWVVEITRGIQSWWLVEQVAEVKPTPDTISTPILLPRKIEAAIGGQSNCANGSCSNGNQSSRGGSRWRPFGGRFGRR